MTDDQIGRYGSESGNSDTTRVVNLVQAAARELFHSSDGEAYITFREGPPFVAWPLRSEATQDKVARMFYRTHKRVPALSTIGDALRLLSATARFEGPECPVFVRVGGVGRELYLDLGDTDGNVVLITEHGWAVINDADVKFRRPPGQSALPIPIDRSFHLENLSKFCSAARDDITLIAAVLCSWVRPTGPYPVLVLQGEQGTGKSTTARLLKQIVDPGAAILRTPPMNVRDLMIAARNTHVLSIDNVDRVPVWLSDALCRLSTGGAFTTRRLYADTDEVIMELQRPVILNGIGQIVTRGDLIDRAIVIEPPRIKERRQVTELDELFLKRHPAILGAVLDATVRGLSRIKYGLPSTNLRMADFAGWSIAITSHLSRGWFDFRELYERNRENAQCLALDASPVASALLEFMRQRSKPAWIGEANQLLDELRQAHSYARDLPPTAAALSNELTRIKAGLGNRGLHFRRRRERKGGRRILECQATGGNDPQTTLKLIPS